MVESTIARESNVETSSGVPSHDASGSLPRRDYLVLPLLSLTTVVLLLGVTEVGARILYPRQETDSCGIYTASGPRYRPNCTSTLKNAEGPWATYEYNECGYRTTAGCGPKPAGAVRIVLLGSSVTHGAYVPYEKTFATRIGDLTARDLKRPVQIENLGITGYPNPLESYRRLDEAIKLAPDVVVFSLAATDVEKLRTEQVAERDNPNARFAEPKANRKAKLFDTLHKSVLEASTTVLMAQHFLFQDTDLWLRISLAGGDHIDYLHPPFTRAWETRFFDITALVDEMAGRLRARDIPLILVALPTRVQVAMLSPKRRQPGVDAWAFGRRMKRVAEEAGATYVDLIYPLSLQKRPEELYYVVDSSHPTSDGHEFIAREITPVVERFLSSR
jgi:lysophospholipase L1-like esterase